MWSRIDSGSGAIQLEQKDAISSVTESLKARKRQKRQKLLRIYMWRVFILSLIAIATVTLHQLDVSSYTRVSDIIVSGHQSLNSYSIIEQSGVKPGQRVWLIHDFFQRQRWSQMPLIRKAKVTTKGTMVLISIEEYRILGQLQNSQHVLLQNGQTMDQESLNLHLRANTLIVGFEDAVLQEKLAKSFEKVHDGVMMYISEIHRTSVSYDDAMIMLLLDDGNRVYTDFAGIELMNEYRLILNHLKPENKCIWLDALTRAASSVPCDGND
mgnify:CR=1 FL=1